MHIIIYNKILYITANVCEKIIQLLGRTKIKEIIYSLNLTINVEKYVNFVTLNNYVGYITSDIYYQKLPEAEYLSFILTEDNNNWWVELYNKDGSEITHNYNFNTSIAKIKTLHNGNIYAYRNLNIIE